MELNLFPWDNDEKPYWVNPENGLEWYVDKESTKWCRKETLNNLPILNAVVFYIVKEDDGNRKPISRVLMDIETNRVLADETSLEGLAAKIDWLRLASVKDE